MIDLKERKDALVKQHGELVAAINSAVERRLRIEGAIAMLEEQLNDRNVPSGSGEGTGRATEP